MNLLQRVTDSPLAAGVVIGDDARALLESLQDAGTPDQRATLTADAALPSAFGASLPAGATLKWQLVGAGNGFRMTLTLAGAASLPVPGVSAASRTESGAGVRRRARLTATGALTFGLTGAI